VFWSIFHIFSGIAAIIALYFFGFASLDTSSPHTNLLWELSYFSYPFLLIGYFTIYAIFSLLIKNILGFKNFTTLDDRLKLSGKASRANFRSALLISLIIPNIVIAAATFVYFSITMTFGGGMGDLIILMYPLVACGIYSSLVIVAYLLSYIETSDFNVKCRKITFSFQLSLLAILFSFLLLTVSIFNYNNIPPEVTKSYAILKGIKVGSNSSELESIIENYKNMEEKTKEQFYIRAHTFDSESIQMHGRSQYTIENLQDYVEGNSHSRGRGIDIQTVNKIRNDLAKDKMLDTLSNCVNNPRLIIASYGNPLKTNAPKTYLISDDKILGISTFERNGSTVKSTTAYDKEIIGVNKEGYVTLCDSELSSFYSQTFVSDDNKFSIIPSRNCFQNYFYDASWNAETNRCTEKSSKGLVIGEYQDLEREYINEILSKLSEAGVDIDNLQER